MTAETSRHGYGSHPTFMVLQLQAKIAIVLIRYEAWNSSTKMLNIKFVETLGYSLS